jgi:hypothetical protein
LQQYCSSPTGNASQPLNRYSRRNSPATRHSDWVSAFFAFIIKKGALQPFAARGTGFAG